MGLSAADIIGVVDVEVRAVPVPEWKGSVYLRVLPADEGLALNDAMQALSKEKRGDAIFLLLAACLCDEKGTPLFASEAEAKGLRRKSNKVLARLQDEALVLQGWQKGQEGEAGKA
jgi:hypothetical protein